MPSSLSRLKFHCPNRATEDSKRLEKHQDANAKERTVGSSDISATGPGTPADESLTINVSHSAHFFVRKVRLGISYSNGRTNNSSGTSILSKLAWFV